MSMKVDKEQFIGVTYDELLALNDELLAFNDELLAENEHMRLKDLAVMGELAEENELLQADNAKLRELCADMLMSPQDYCEKYGIEYEGWSSADDHIDARMRELEVDW